MFKSQLQQSIRLGKVKLKKEEPIDVRQYLFAKMKEEVMAWLDSAKGEILDVVDRVVAQEVNDFKQGANKIVSKEIDKVRENELRNIKKGDKGADSFVPGPKGDTVVGPAGKNGKDGVKGKDGKNGVDGKDGINGKDGSPDTVDEIANKLNTKENIVEMSVIIGLKEMFANMQRAFNQRERGGGSGGGGGIGNVQHEVTATSSATTTVTTVYKIAGNGQALWVTYNGQDLAKGTHYTVGGDQKTVTFLFTLQDSTNVQITYFRT